MAKKTWLKNNPKVLIFIVSYNAETFIGSVLDRIPETVWQNEEYSVEILVIGDHSDDNTFQKVTEYIHFASVDGCLSRNFMWL